MFAKVVEDKADCVARRRRIAKATGGSLVLTLADMDGNESFDPSLLGTAEEVGRLFRFRAHSAAKRCRRLAHTTAAAQSCWLRLMASPSMAAGKSSSGRTVVRRETQLNTGCMHGCRSLRKRSQTMTC